MAKKKTAKKVTKKAAPQKRVLKEYEYPENFNEIRIEKNMPIPATNVGGKWLTIYPLEKMEVGDSFAVQCNWDSEKGASIERGVHAARNAARNAMLPRFYVQKRVIEDNIRKIRVWRAADKALMSKLNTRGKK